MENNDIVINQEKPLDLVNPSAYELALRNNPEVISLTNEIKANDGNSVLSFGQKPAEEISSISNTLLATIKRTDAEDASKMINQLTKVMDKFDIKELEDTQKDGLISKFFNPIAKKIDKLKSKYENIGKEVDEISIILNQNRSDLQLSNDNLKKLYEANIAHRETLEKYIVAGSIAQQQLEDYKNNLNANPNISDGQKQLELQQLEMIGELLSQRIMALRTAENTALQTGPMLQMMMMANYNLMNKINSSFIITLPIFKNSLIQAIELKRQSVVQDSLSKLDEKTQELWIKNAQNTSTQFAKSIQSVNSQALPVEKLKESYAIIQQGIQEAKELNRQQLAKRIEDTKQLELLKTDMTNQGILGTTAEPKLLLQ